MFEGPDTKTSGGVLGAIPDDLPAIQAERDSYAEFDIPLLTRVLVVAGYEGERPAVEQLDLARRILGVSEHFRRETPGFVAGLPVPETVWPHSQANAETVIVTYVFFDGRLSASEQLEAADRFRDALRTETGANFAGVTGALKANHEQASIVDGHVHWIEGGTLILVFAIVALRFRSIVAPAVALLAGGIAYVASMALLGEVQASLDMDLSTEIRPLLAVLVFGVVTDYSIFYLGSFRRSIAESGVGGPHGAWRTWRSVTPIVLVAAIIVAVGGMALSVAEIALVRSMAAGIALAIGLSFVTSVIFTPLALACLGRVSFWPDDPRLRRKGASLRGWSERQIVRRWVAVPVLIVLAGGLVFAALQAGDARIATTLIRDLADSNEASAAEQVASRSIPAGAIAPTVLLITGPTDNEMLRRLAERIQNSPGVAAVVGPHAEPALLDAGILRAASGNAVRFLIVFDTDPYGAAAIDHYQTLADGLPGHLGAAGMTNVEARFAGDTAVSAQVSEMAFDDLIRVGAIVLVLEVVILTLFLRSLLAPPMLMAISTLLVLASLGVTAILSGLLLSHESLNLLVPIATMVLLLSLGADYNLFLIGQVWSAQRRLPFSEALYYAATESSSTILTAGLALTASFAILALVPLTPFRQIALALSIGLLADTLVIRPLLVPAFDESREAQSAADARQAQDVVSNQ